MADSDASPPSNSHSRRTGKQPEYTDDGPSEPRPPRSSHAHHDDKRQSKAIPRSHKHRSSGAFLLPDALHVESSSPEWTHSHRRRHTAAENQTTNSRFATPEKVHSDGTSIGSQTVTPESASRRSARTSETIAGVAAAQRDSLTDASTLEGSPRSSAAPLDMDSAQIVNMALNLSESRRLAARRNISSPLPPRLAPLPDSAAGGSLRQHLQQQRRVSRNISPRPGAAARSASTQKIPSPLSPGFEQDGSYRYHFSQSTLSRAQKAKDYMELFAQYRKVLELVPPLTSGDSRRTSAISPYGSPAVSRTTTRSFEPEKLGRPYNPLQYIRNRKVRARERKTIDGEKQGFSDVPRVTEWVEEAAKSVASGHVAESGSTLPPFNTPEEVLNGSTQSTLQPVVTVSKPKRSRIDWVIDPADLLADIYWLEQGTNKNLVEDRNGKRVFLQDSSLYRPFSRQLGANTLPAPFGTGQESAGLRVESDGRGLEQKTTKPEHDHMFGGARERAQQKLQAIRGLHHRHNGSVHHRHSDILHSRNDSLSDSSDSDSDRKGRNRAGTVGSSGKEILERQMMEMIAREQREKELETRPASEARRQRSLTGESTAAEDDSVIHSTVPSRAPSLRRQQLVAESRETDTKPDKTKAHPASPLRSTRASLEVPSSGGRFSIDYDTSHPASPDLKRTREHGLVPALGKDWSPRPSRASSPSRNPLSKVKSIFRDRSRERAAHSDDRGAGTDTEAAAAEVAPDAPFGTVRKRSTERKGSISPIRKIISRGSESSNRSPRNHGSLRLRGDEASSSLRALLKAPRIDSVLRSGVSRVSDFIWRKDADAADGHSLTSSDESDTEPGRGRTRETPPQADTPGAKTYLDVMPSFESTSRSKTKLPQDDQGLLYTHHPSSRPPSRQSSRFDLLKPPKIDVQGSSPTSSPPAPKVRSNHDSDTSATDSRKSSHASAARAATNLNAAIAMPKPRRLSSSGTQAQRHWSISDGRPAQPDAAVSRAEIARLRALVLSSGIMAKEIDRRARERRVPGPDTNLLPSSSSSRRPSFTASVSSSSPTRSPLAPIPRLTWTSISALHPDPVVRANLLTTPVSQIDLFPTAARTLATAIEDAGTDWHYAAQRFQSETAPNLHRQVELARQTVAGRLSDMTRAAGDEADEVSLDLGQGQRLKVQRVVDVIEKMLRRRRRRFRWVRRGLWLGVEWVLVGFMWYVWFVVVIARMVLGVGQGVVGGIRWLLWL